MTDIDFLFLLHIKSSRSTKVKRLYILRLSDIKIAGLEGLRGGLSFLEIVFVGQCEVFVCLEFVEIFFSPWPRSSEAHERGVTS